MNHDAKKTALPALTADFLPKLANIESFKPHSGIVGFGSRPHMVFFENTVRTQTHRQVLRFEFESATQKVSQNRRKFCHLPNLPSITN